VRRALPALLAAALLLALPTSADLGQLLPVDGAFRLLAARRDGDAIVVSWLIVPGYYLYRNRVQIRATRPAGVRLQPPQLPEAARLAAAEPESADAHPAIYRIALRAVLHWDSAGPAPRQLAVSYQGCADAGFCYPPQTRTLDVAGPSP
jgi:thiol:disulfide interchange protein DsbD